MYPNPQSCGQFFSRVPGGTTPPLTPRVHPAAMIKAAHGLNNNYPSTAMASPFFVDNLLHHQKAAANFQSQFVNSQLHSYIQEQHHQFLMHQSQMRQQQALKFTEEMKQSDGLKIPTVPQSAENFSSRNASPISEGSPRIDYEEDEDFNKETDKKTQKNCDTESEVMEDSHSPEDEIDRYTDSPSRSPIGARLQSRLKNEFRMSPTNYANNFYSDSYKKFAEEKLIQLNRKDGNKDETQDDNEANSDQEKKELKLNSPCSNCGSYECNPFYPMCKNMRRYDSVDRIYLRHDPKMSPYEDRNETKNGENYGSPHGSDMNNLDDREMKDTAGDKDGHHVIKATDVVKRCGSSLDSGQVGQKPVLKFSVSAILGQDLRSSSERNNSSNAMKIGQHGMIISLLRYIYV